MKAKQETVEIINWKRKPYADGQVLTERRAGELVYLTFPAFEALKGIRHLFTTREGGVSEGCFSSLNLSFTRGDKEEAVAENYRRVAELFGVQTSDIVCSDQTHTTNIRRVTAADKGKGVVFKRDYSDVDGLLTDEAGILLATFYADCVPLYFADPVRRVIGLAHSGWRGTVGRIGAKMIQKMETEYGCKKENIFAAVGPSICQDCYEVSEDVAEQFLKEFGEEVLRNGRQEGKYQLDLWHANEKVLLDAGLLKERISVTDICTCCNADYLFSHRASQGKRGNLGAFLMMEKTDGEE